MFRKAKGLGEQGFFEKAEKIFQDLLKDNPPDAPAIRVELDRLRAMDKEREKQHNQKFKGAPFNISNHLSPANLSKAS